MCYSLEISRNSFIINIIACFILYTGSSNPSFKILALFFGFVGTMQLFDWIFWANQDMSEPNQEFLNKTFTPISMIVNHLQPIFLAFLIIYFNGSLNHYSMIALLIYTVFVCCYSFNLKLDYTLVHTIDTVKGPVNSLFWQWNFQKGHLLVYITFLITLAIMAYENFPSPLNWIFVFINFASFIFSGFWIKGNDQGRWWCEISSLIPLALLVLEKIKL